MFCKKSLIASCFSIVLCACILQTTAGAGILATLEKENEHLKWEATLSGTWNGVFWGNVKISGTVHAKADLINVSASGHVNGESFYDTTIYDTTIGIKASDSLGQMEEGESKKFSLHPRTGIMHDAPKRWAVNVNYELFPEAPTVMSGDNDNELIIKFSDSFRAGETKAYEVEVRRKTPQGDWQHGCTSVSGAGPGGGTAPVTITISGLESGTTYQVRYRDSNDSSCPPPSPTIPVLDPSGTIITPDPWSPIGEGTTSGVQENGEQPEEISSDENELKIEVVEDYPSPPAGYTVLDGLTVSKDRIVFRIGGLFQSAGIGGCIQGGGTISINGVSYQMHSSKWIRRDNSTSPWVDVPTTARDQELCGYSPTSAGEYTVVIEVNADGVREKYVSSTLLRVTGDSPSTPTASTPDLVVEDVRADPVTVAPGEKFKLYATLKNQGRGESTATRIRYYRSTDEVISTEDTQLGSANRDPLAANATIRRYLTITASTTPGTYYYGVCVDSVTDESDTANNCSMAVSVTVTAPPMVAEDVNGDGVVDVKDLVYVAERYGQTGTTTADVNGDGVVNIDDLILVAAALDADAAAAPSLYSDALEQFSVSDVQLWLSQARQRDVADPSVRKGILFLEQLLASMVPKETVLLANYPNPFNPETWIPYQLAKPAEVTITIYAINGQAVRTLALGHQVAGMYQSRSRAAYWDGKNELGEAVASGLYFYTLTAGDFSATRKMLIRK